MSSIRNYVRAPDTLGRGLCGCDGQRGRMWSPRQWSQPSHKEEPLLTHMWQSGDTSPFLMPDLTLFIQQPLHNPCPTPQPLLQFSMSCMYSLFKTEWTPVRERLECQAKGLVFILQAMEAMEGLGAEHWQALYSPYLLPQTGPGS